MNRNPKKVFGLHLAILFVLFLMQFVLPAYHHTTVARIMVLAVYAMGYNIAFGYTGLLSLGHAMFFGAGMYGMGLLSYHFDCFSSYLLAPSRRSWAPLCS